MQPTTADTPHGLFFEVEMKPGHMDHYFAHVDLLRPVLAQHTGMRWIERFRPSGHEDSLLSHQIWESEAALAGWRRDALHRRSQTAGRTQHFADYRIRVAPRILHLEGGAATETPCAPDGRLMIAVYAAAPFALPGAAWFASVVREGSCLALADMADAATARATARDAAAQAGVRAASVFAVTRDYGMFRRAEAPEP
jgi:heme-degrading monooxygenase HmoA